MEMPLTSQEALATNLAALQIAVEQSGECYNLFMNTAGATENHGYYFSLNVI